MPESCMNVENAFEPFNPFVSVPQEYIVQSTKTNIRGILDSYHGDWDFLIEMLQNAVDALEEKFGDGKGETGETPRIEVAVNIGAGTVRVSDNGIGMDAEAAPPHLR